MRDVGPKTRDRVGRPYVLESLPLDVIIPIMMKDAMNGGFFEELPGTLYKETNHLVGLRTLCAIQDEEFLQAKEISNALCMQFWKEQMAMATIPASVYIWFTRNKFKWRDDRSLQLELAPSQSEKLTPEFQELLKLRLQELKRGS